MGFLSKVVIITGASSGIGAATAVQLAKLGANLCLIGRNGQNLAAVLKECKDTSRDGSDHLSIIADVTKPKDVGQVIKDVVSRFNRIDVLINSAGILENGTIENTSLEQYDRVMNTNMRSIYNLTMEAVPHLIKTQGNIVNVSSVNGIRAFPNVLAYNVSKAAVDQFTRCTALELASKNVRVNAVNPGVTVTQLHRNAGMDEAAYQKFLEHSKSTHALGRPGMVQEVAEAITFLASERASFITGASLPVDGGRHAMCPR